MPLDGVETRLVVRVDTDVASLSTIAPALSAAAGDASFVSSHPDWHRACLQAFHRDADELRHLTAFKGGQARASLPLVRAQRGGVGWLELCGSQALYEPGEIVYDSVEALDAVLQAAIALRDPIELTRIRADPELRASLRRCARRRGFVVRIDAPRAVHVDLRECHGRLEALVPSAKRRRELERRRRRLGEFGAIDCQWLRPDAGDVDAVMGRTLGIEDSGWKRRAGSSMAQRSDVHAFVLGVARSFAERGHLIVAFLTLDGQAIAMQVILADGHAWSEVKIGYDERWRHIAPGMLLAVATLLRASEEGMERYEFMGNEEPRHSDFAHRTQAFDTLVYVPFNFRGARALGQIARSRASRRLAALAGRRPAAGDRPDDEPAPSELARP